VRAKFFASAEAFRAWLRAKHDKETALVVGFHKKATGKRSITYPEALDEALCFGWIDGIRHGAADSYTIRFSGRQAGSTWSLVNIAHVKRLIAAGRMQAPGLKAFEARDEKAAAHYSYERKTRELDPALAATFKADKRAWRFSPRSRPAIDAWPIGG
jgi:uncharacterized protein YdeI (YjbR/CyaY-like superfamily)